MLNGAPPSPMTMPPELLEAGEVDELPELLLEDLPEPEDVLPLTVVVEVCDDPVPELLPACEEVLAPVVVELPLELVELLVVPLEPPLEMPPEPPSTLPLAPHPAR
jgi:hypothetical protein